MKRIAFVITELEAGGAERALVRLATGLDRERFQPMVISLADRPVGDRSLVTSLGEAEVPVEFLRIRSAWQVASGRSRMRRVLREFDPDVVQSFLFHANVMAALAVDKHVPLVFGMRVADPRRARMTIEGWAARRARKIVCVSEGVRELAMGRAAFDAEKTIVIPNCVDLEPFERATPTDLAPLGIAADRRVLLFLGRLTAQKGLDWLLSMAVELLGRLPGHELVIVGAGPQQAHLDAFQRQYPAARVHALGWRPDVAGLLRRAELLLLPSRWEGMPNAVLEAMAAGIPVVATDVEGVSEALGPAATEQTVPFGDSRRWLARVEEMAEDASLRLRLGRANRDQVARRHAPSQMVDAYQRLYDHL